MKLRYKILNVILALLAVGVLSIAIRFSYDADCGPPPSLTPGATPMKAVVHRCYGAPEVAELREVEKPTPKHDEVLVMVRAAAVNPLDWHEMRGEPYIVRASNGFGAPKDGHLGVDFAGTVIAGVARPRQGPGRTESPDSTGPRAAWARSPCRSPSNTALTSLESAARATWSWCGRSAPIA
jgi:hypothetical protein